MSDMKKCANDFIFDRVIGEGSFSTVFLGVEVHRSYEVAIKVCEKALIRREKKENAIFREKTCLHMLTINPSPFFIQLLCTFQDETRLFFVMNYAKNGELLSLINERQVFNDHCCRFYSAEILLALEHMHRLGIVHRDLKPENILLNDKLHIQVSDFGSALLMKETNNENNDRLSPNSDDQNNVRRRNSFVGTAHYVSPEMLTNKTITSNSDLWAFGCILYQMVCGSTPFRAANEYLIFQKIIKLEFEFPQEFDKTASNLIKKILKIDANDRLGSSDDVKNDGYISIKSDPYFKALSDDWSLHEKKPPVSETYFSNNSRNDTNITSINENIEPGLAENQITRIMGLALHEDYDKVDSNTKKGILDITEVELNERLNQQKEHNMYHRFVENNLILKEGFIDKKKGLFARRRMFLLTTGPHLYYVDSSNMVLKGQIPFSKNMRPEAKNFRNFFIHTPNRSYILEDISNNAPEWCRVVEEVRDMTFGPPIAEENSTGVVGKDVCRRKISVNNKYR
ncbi:3-phosphoinositide-dependent protein kinase 1-like [Oppia nitens]|uniref:3-phosphoinositide-dependent protein kinase 1-like n=1 Tax=Oppia nitens TaxID=1686743 RepID=UPI0023DAA1FB|nr:3-phosphoinositide-dependent protein kinase 1-like [Oppia nitens]